MGQDNRHIAGLDGLRGSAALAVFLAHAGSEGFIELSHTYGLGKIGVALFYTLSGFLMAYLYLDRPWTKFELHNYMVARFARILPLFYVAVLFGVVMLYASGSSLYGFSTPAQIVLNFGFIRGNGVLWSIPVEVQFYLIFMALWAAAARRMLVPAIGVLLAIQLTTFFAIGGAEGTSNALVYWGHYFLVGLIIARLYSRYGVGFAQVSAHRAAGWGAAGLLLVCIALMPGLRIALGWDPLPIFADPFVLLGVFLFVLLSLLGRGPFRVFATPVMGWLGARSFGIYLFHVPVLLLATDLMPVGWMRNGAGFLCVLVVTLVVADVLNRLVERPAGRFIRSKLMLPQKLPLRPGALGHREKA